jgi:heat shock protein 4
MVSKSSVIGIDLGSATSFVGYVGKGIVDIVQNEVSKRDTPSLVGFTDRERLLGDAALSQIKSNAKNSCRNFKHLMGQNCDSPYVEKEHFWSTSKLGKAEDGHPGYEVVYKGTPRTMSATQVCAMMLTKLREVTEKWTEGKVADCVIGVPSYFSDAHRQAILDAAKIAGVSVLRLMNEHTATALAYGIYRTNDFDPEKPMTVAFCSMGHTIFSVSVVQFVRGKLTCLCEKSDKVGGRDMDECLMREFAAQFKKKVGCDPLSNKKAAFKLEDAVTKTKKILSANSEAGINCECLMEDEDFASNITRDIFLNMCQPMMDKVQAVLDAAKAACGLTMDQIDVVEIVGGATRVPWVKEMCSKAFGRELSTTMNADESVARGCALQAAILSPLYKVRDFSVNDISPYGVSVGWMGSAADAEAKTEEEADTQHMAAAEGEYKTATVFPAGSAMNTCKLLTFYRKGPFEIKAEYVDESLLIPGTSKCLGTYKIDIPPQPEPKKVKVKANLTIHGTFTISSAQIVETEEYEETRKEKREVEPTPEEIAKAEEEAKAAAEAAAAAEGAPPAEGAEGEKKEPEKKAPEKKYEWVDVTKKKTRTKHTDVPIIPSNVPGLPAAELQKRMDEESAMQADMAEIIETDEKRNDLESYILNMRDKTTSSGEYGEFIIEADRQKFHADLTKIEDWLYDTEDATKVMYVEKLDELKVTGDPVVWRYKESQIRGEWSTALAGTISNYKTAAQNPGEKYGHISPDKLGKIVAECDKTMAWLKDLEAKQAGMAKHERPILVCADMDQKNKDLAQFADDILKEPKPKPPEPPKEEKKEEAKEGDKKEGEAPAEEAKKASGAEDVD